MKNIQSEIPDVPKEYKQFLDNSIFELEDAVDKIMWVSTMLNSDDNTIFTGEFNDYKVVITKKQLS